MKRAALLLLGITLPAFADRFNVTFEGKPVSRAQVCASRAGDLASPMTRFFTGTATVCFPADGEVQLPPGTWNVFARRGAELISDSVVLATGGGTKTHDLALMAAASVEHDDAPLYAYVPATGAVIPVTDIVPATRIVPLIVKAGRVQAIGAPVTPKAGKINRFEFPEEKGSVIVPVTLEGKGEPPQVALAGTAQRADSSLLFFRNVPTGIQMIELHGDPWMAMHRPVNVNAEAIAVAEPLVARVVTTLRVHWSRGKVEPNDRDCDGKPANPLPLTLTLLACSDEAGSRCGITRYESSFAGIGGCPFAPGASGNICSEDLVYMLHELGIETGIDLAKLIECARLVERIIGRELPGQVMKAGPRTKRFALADSARAVG